MITCPHCKRAFEIPKLKCKRCGHEWIQRTDELPTICPKCKNPYWNKERIKQVTKKGV